MNTSDKKVIEDRLTNAMDSCTKEEFVLDIEKNTSLNKEVAEKVFEGYWKIDPKEKEMNDLSIGGWSDWAESIAKEKHKEVEGVHSQDKLLLITQDNKKDYPFEGLDKYSVVEKTPDFSIIEYNENKEVYGVVLFEESLDSVGSIEDCKQRVIDLDQSLKEYVKEQNELNKNYVDPIDLQPPVDETQLEWKKELAERNGVDLERYNEVMIKDKEVVADKLSDMYIYEISNKKVEEWNKKSFVNDLREKTSVSEKSLSNVFDTYTILSGNEKQKQYLSNWNKVTSIIIESNINPNKSNVMEEQNNQNNEEKKSREFYVGFANKKEWNNDPTEKSYLLNIDKDKVMKQEGDKYGSVKVGIKRFEQEHRTDDGKVEVKETHSAILYPKKNDPDLEAVVSIKKAALQDLKSEGDYNNVYLVVANRNPKTAKTDDLVVYENKVKKGMSEDEKKKVQADKNYVGTGWTQKPEMLKLEKDQLTKENLKSSIESNNAIKVEAIIQRKKGLATKEMVDLAKEMGKREDVKTNPKIAEVLEQANKKNKKKGLTQ